MRKLSEGNKMFISVMVIFIIYAGIFVLFEDYDRYFIRPLEETSDWHLLLFSAVMMAVLGVMLHRYARRMDDRISREQADKENQMRRELTQNIAHELKTPVASILGYTDTMLEHPDMDSGVQRQFLERAQSQARRLTALLQDLSTLNRMDYAADMITMERVDVSRIVADIVQETALSAERRHMTVYNHLPQGIIVDGNKSLIYSVFRNLMDNAINYAGMHKSIEIRAQEGVDEWHFTFADNGNGVGEEHLSRIFERFTGSTRVAAVPWAGLGWDLPSSRTPLSCMAAQSRRNPPRGRTALRFLH